MPDPRTYRIGIDVGGTFTKAVLIDNATYEVVGRYSVLTTHSDARGVAKGVVEVFRNVLERSAVDPADVVFLAHSTTQATNALLEGDVAAVGIIGMASRVEALLARSQSSIKEIELAPGRHLRPGHRFITRDGLDPAAARAALEELRAEGAQVVVATSAFGVDDQTGEELVMREAAALGMAATGGHEISKLYGLTTRTRTAVINASILPKMIGTANMTEASVREAGISAPLMIMRGDGGVMDVQEMRRRPVVTMLSGPAASVAGALMYLKVSDGIYFEVGGTSTNIGVIRNGRPTVKHARVGGHDTYVNSLDVRVLGIAGGSMVRVRGSEIVDVGPRSAHIAGLPYAAFAGAEDIQAPELELFNPKQGDPDDYAAIRVASGARYAITNTCAANVLGYAKPGWHACGNREAAQAAMLPLAARLGLSVEEAARHILEKASGKVIPVVESLIAEYGLDRDQSVLVGEGGGAAALIPFVAERMNLDFKISQDAEVISSIGVALAMVRETVERVIPNPTPEDLQRIKREASEAAVRLGAAAENVEVTIEVNAQTQRVRATAVGTSEMRAQDLLKEVTEAQARDIAAASMGLSADSVKLAAATDQVRVFQGEVVERKWRFFTSRRRPVRAVDREGVIRVQRSDGIVVGATAGTGIAQLRRCWEEVTIYNGDSVITPDVFVIAGRRVVDLSGITALDQATTIGRSELEGLPDEAAIAIIGVQGARGV
jgi:N-methylhydantoinase A